MRFAVAPDGAVLPDVAAKAPGRGVWVRADRASVEAAVKRGAFPRGFKAEARPPADLADATEAFLARRCLELLGLGRRAGALAIGQQQVEEAIRRARPFSLIEASDGAEDGRERVLRLHKALWGAPDLVVGAFTAAELGVALGRDHVVHACWLQERLATRWAAEIGRLAGFRAILPAGWRFVGSSDPDRAAQSAEGGAAEGGL